MPDETRTISQDLAELVAEANDNTVKATPESQPETADETVTEPETKEETPAPSQEEPKAEETKPEDSAQKKEVPFHKHPRWIRKQQEAEELKTKLEALEQKLQSQQQPNKEEKRSIPDAFVKLFGENEEAWNEYQRLREMDKLDARAEVQRILEEEKAREAQEETARTQVIKWAEDRFLELADETGIEFTDRNNAVRNEVLSICEDYSMFDEQGRPNISKAYELYRRLNPPKTEVVEEKKRVAAKTNTKSNAGAKESQVFTPSKLREMERRGGIMQFLN